MPYYLIYLSREIRRFKEWTVSLNYIGNPQQSTELGTKYTCSKCFPVGLLVVVVVMVVCVCVCVSACPCARAHVNRSRRRHTDRVLA